MNKITEIALKRPYTFVVLAIVIVLFGATSVRDTPTDVFPNIRLPCVAVVWSYSGLLPSDVSGRITYFYERALTSTVEGIERLESHSYYGSSIIFIYLHPGTDLAGAEAEITAQSQTVTTALPPDISPPMIMRLEPSSVPVAMLQVTSDTISPAELYNLSIARIRPALVVIPGAIVPHPYGGQPQQLLVSLDRQHLLARHLTPEEVHEALGRQALVLPAGDQKIHATDWMVQTNTSPLAVEEFENIPIRRVDGAMVYVRDVASVSLAGPPQTNSVLVDGQQAVSIVVMKSGEASTLDVVQGIRDAIPRIERQLPPGVHIRIMNDASSFVRESIADVLREMITAAALTGLVVLLFLGSWRATLIIATSIPLSILTALACLHWLGESINIMTLGGLALAVGILVDDATVMIENIDTHLAMNKPLDLAIVDAANQILIPTFVATLCIVIVWFPLLGLSGVSGWLFAPMAEAVMFAMGASFILSRTLVPTMAKYMLGGHGHGHSEGTIHPTDEGPPHTTDSVTAPGASPAAVDIAAPTPPRLGLLARFQRGFERTFDTFRESYRHQLERVVENRGRFIAVFLAMALASLVLFAFAGRDFFPEVRSGTIQMHMRAPLGTRVEVSGRIASRVAGEIRELLPGRVEGVIANCGLPLGPHNLAFIPTPTIGTQDCDLSISLRDEAAPVWDYRRLLRRELTQRYPGTEFTFQPADLTARILNFGSPSPIAVRVQGMDMAENYEFARHLAQRLRQLPGAQDVVIQQTMRTPTLLVEGNRTLGMGLDVTQEQIARNLLLMTSGSQQVDQQFWLNHDTGLSYQINIYTPQPFQNRVEDILTTPVNGGADETRASSPELLGNVATLTAVGTPGVVTHEGIQPVFDVYVSAEDRDLGGLLTDVETVVEDMHDQAPRSANVEIRGQAELMRSAYLELLAGLLASVVLVYLVIVVNFQSWLDPFIIITALPGALAGIAWSLFVTHTSLSVPALTGAIMSMGTATANSILVVSYAKERLEVHGDAARAAVEAGFARLRPVLMTAAAMIIGMLPMSVGNSQNAPLGRAVMGGLTVATLATLFFVPCVYAVVYGRKRGSAPPADLQPGDATPASV
jgi:multidrug efflux pump subunit AcrB